MTVEHIDDAGGVGEEVGVVGDHNNSGAFVVDAGELFHHEARGARVEVAGGLVGEDDFGFGDEGASDGDALLLAARELDGEVVGFFLEIEAGENVGGLDAAVGLRGAGIDEGKGNVVEDGEGGNEVEVLEDEADFLRAEAGFFFVANAGDGFAVQEIDTRGGGVEEANDVEEGGFAAAAGTHNHNELAALDGEVKIFERKSLGVAEAVGTRKTFDANQFGRWVNR